MSWWPKTRSTAALADVERLRACAPRKQPRQTVLLYDTKPKYKSDVDAPRRLIMRHRLMIGVTLLAIEYATPASADHFPKLDVAPLCHGITQQSILQEGFRDVTFDECIKAEQEDRDAMLKEWSTFSAAERTHCIAEATMGGESSYTELITCLEMARDVRLLKKSKKQDQSLEAASGNQSKYVRHHRRKAE